MSDFEDLGFETYRARGVRIALGRTYHGKRCIDTWWMMLEGPWKGREFHGSFTYETMAALRFAEYMLRSAGCTLSSGNIEDFSGFGTMDVNANLRKYKRTRDGSIGLNVNRVDPAPAIDAAQKPVRERLDLKLSRPSNQTFNQGRVVADDLPMSKGGWK